MKPLCCLLLLAGLLCEARTAARPPAASAPASEHPVVGVELRGTHISSRMRRAASTACVPCSPTPWRSTP